jgi:hypothetical protein
MSKKTEAPEGLRGEDPGDPGAQTESPRPPASKPVAITPENAAALPVAPTAQARPEGVSAKDAKTALNFTDNEGGIAQPRKDIQVFSNRALNQLPEGQEKAPPVEPSKTGREIARHTAEHTPGFGKEDK